MSRSGTFLATYDPNRVSVVLNGDEVYGFAEGDMIVVERNEDLFNNYVGTKGEVSRAVNANKTGKITVRLQSTSPFIQTIMAYALADQFGGIPPIINFAIKDPSSYDNVVAAQCWLNVDASHSWGNEVGEREYEFFATNIVTAPNQALATGLAFAAGVSGLL